MFIDFNGFLMIWCHKVSQPGKTLGALGWAGLGWARLGWAGWAGWLGWLVGWLAGWAMAGWLGLMAAELSHARRLEGVGGLL